MGMSAIAAPAKAPSVTGLRQRAALQPAPPVIVRAPAPGPRWNIGSLPIQPKLQIGAADDPLEHEADRVADRVMRMPDNAIAESLPASGPATLRRQCAACAGEDETLHRAAAAPAAPARAEAPASVHAVIGRPGQMMDTGTRRFFEPRFGRDLTQVRLHTDAAAAASARDVGAVAYTVGTDVVFGAGQFDAHTESGRRLMAHELAHVMQNDAGNARPTLRRTSHGPGTPTNCHNWKIPLPPWIAGTVAHGQISTTLGIPPHGIPRATKLLKGLPSPPSITPRGFADLWSRGSAAVDIAEIKSTATGGVVAADDAKHYITRHDEWLGRQTSGTGDAVDATYLADVGGPIPGAPLDLSSITGSDLILGNFWGDPAKQLHIEGDAAGAVVYWCTGAGLTVSPLWLIALKKALDALAKKLQEAKKKFQEVAARIGEGLGKLAKMIRSALLPLLVVLILFAIVAMLLIAIVCAFFAPETLGLTLICSAAGLAGALGSAAVLLLLIGVSLDPGVPDKAASVFRAARPDLAAAEPESGSDYERDADTGSATSITSTASASAAVAGFNPGDDLLAALRPMADQFSDPLGLIGSITGKLGNLDDGALAKLNDAVATLDANGDSGSAEFIRGAIKNSGLDQPGALSQVDSAGGSSDDAARAALAAAAPATGTQATPSPAGATISPDQAPV